MLPKHEEIRSRRERDFQQRVLHAIEKRQENRFIKFINAPFFLWILSALFLAFGGLYLNGYQACMKEAVEVTEKYMKLRAEIRHRQSAIVERLTGSDNIAALRANMGQALPHLYNDYKDIRLHEIQMELRKTSQRLNNVHPALHGVSDPAILTMPIRQAIANAIRFKLFEVGQLGFLTDSEFQDLKSYADTLSLKLSIESTKDFLTSATVECSLPTVILRQLFGLRPKLASLTFPAVIPHENFVPEDTLK